MDFPNAPEKRIAGVWFTTGLLKMYGLWLICGGIFFPFFFFIGLAVGEGKMIFVGLLGTIGPLPPFLAWLAWYTRAATRDWSWSVEGDHIRIKHGVILRKTKRIPFARVQDVIVKQGPFLRGAGLTTLLIQTASTGANNVAEGMLPGVARGEEMAEWLLEHIKQVNRS